MEVTTYSDFKKNLKGYMKSVNENSDILIVTSQDKNDVVFMGKSDYDSLMESLHLLTSKANRKHIQCSLVEVENEEFVEVFLEDLVCLEERKRCIG